MKKFFILLLSAIFAVTIMTGCNSCETTNEVSFALNWANNPTSGYKETCVYDVTYLANYNENGYNYSKSDIGVEISVANSTYTTVTEIVSSNGLDIPEGDKHIDADYNRTFYKLTTDLALNVSYTINGVTEVFNDKVTSTTYFYDHNNAFAPIYSTKSYDTTNVELGTNGKATKVIRYVYDTTAIYDKGNATIKFAQDSNLPEDTTLSYCPIITTPTATVEGKYKAFIDNETLLFAFRNLNLENSFYIDVALPSYLNIETVAVSKIIGGNNTINLSINGNETAPVTMNATTIAYCRSDETFTGSPILATVQNDTFTYNGQNYNNAYLLKLVTRLPNYSGAMCYTLNSVTVAE